MFDYVKKFVGSLMGRRPDQVNKNPRIIPKEVHGIDPKQVHWTARRTCEALQARGYKAYIVGGAVRDLLLGVTPKDFDVATDATPEQVKRSQRRALIIGRRFRLVHVIFGQEVIECSTFRALDAAGVRKDADGRVISDNVFGEMWEDAARRDFTINALYYDPSTEEVFDYHGGYEDIQRRRLCMIGEPVERYREDPVRMMRAVRIASKLGFAMERRTEQAIPRMAHTLEHVPHARLFDEMMKLFTSGHAESCLIKLRKEGLHRSLLPMLDVILNEKEGEEFLMLALKRTDERIAAGKKISPAFLFATLLWPQTAKRWAAYEARPRMIRSKALYAAAEDVLATQCAKLSIQNRFVADIKLIWMLQLRFERRTGKNPYSLIEHPKYRAGYDFMLLRSQLGHVDPAVVAWWENFVAADEEGRALLIEQAQKEARQTAPQARAGRSAATSAEDERVQEGVIAALEEERKPRRQRRRGPRKTKVETAETAVGSDAPAQEVQQAPAAGEAADAVPAKPRRRRRKTTPNAEAEQGAAAPSTAPESAAAGETPAKPRRRRSVKKEAAPEEQAS